jgi:hypothetical protein
MGGESVQQHGGIRTIPASDEALTVAAMKPPTTPHATGIQTTVTRMTRSTRALAPTLALSASLAGALPFSSAWAQDADDASYFGFDGLEVVKIDPKAGPIADGDFNGDGRTDLAVANNYKSRIELHLQKPGATPDDPADAPNSVNEVPPHWRFRRVEIPVSHQVNAIVPFDFDSDGMLDIVYAGQPGTIVFLRQTKPGVFEVDRRIPQKGLTQSRDGFLVADLVGDARRDLVAIVSGQPTIWQLDGSKPGDPVRLGSSGDQIVALLVGDFNGDGANDLAGIMPESPTPVRIWLASVETDAKGATARRLGSERRFEMPSLREATSFRLPGGKKDLLARIERQTKRIVVEELVEDAGGSRDAALEVFAAAGGKNRSTAVGDVDGDGLADVVVTDPVGSAVTVFRQRKDRGLQPGTTQPSFAEIDAVAVGDTDGKPGDEVFVLSEKEGVVGRSSWTDGALGFPTAMQLSPGVTPSVLSLVRLESGPRVAVVTKDGRNYQLELLQPGSTSGDAGASEVIKLGALVKGPDAVLGLDADQDGRTDLLLLTADKPMAMLQAVEKDGKPAFELRESKDMAQFGLAQAAAAGNSVAFDVDGDGRNELVIADRNFIRALRYAPSATPPGWQVVAQMNAERADAKLVALTVRGGTLVAADRENGTLAVFARDASGKWTQTDEHPVSGFKFGAVAAGGFSGGSSQDVLLEGDDGFAIARLDGGRLVLEETATFRPDRLQQVDHELVAGDVNGDGYLDVVTLDAGEQSLGILSFSQSGRLVPMTRFKVFESRLFQAGEPREFEPSMGLICDLTGDGAPDLVLLCHDRVLLYPQSRKAAARPE